MDQSIIEFITKQKTASVCCVDRGADLIVLAVIIHLMQMRVCYILNLLQTRII